jgi:hypothetical protein
LWLFNDADLSSIQRTGHAPIYLRKLEVHESYGNAALLAAAFFAIKKDGR